MLVILGVMLILECMPRAIVMHFFAGPGETSDTYVPYYDLLPTGYATFFPMFMMTYTVILMIIYIINLFLPNVKVFKILSWIFLSLLLFSGFMHEAFYQNSATVYSHIIFALILLLYIGWIGFVFLDRKQSYNAKMKTAA